MKAIFYTLLWMVLSFGMAYSLEYFKAEYVPRQMPIHILVIIFGIFSVTTVVCFKKIADNI